MMVVRFVGALGTNGMMDASSTTIGEDGTGGTAADDQHIE